MKPEPERFLPYAREGVERRPGVLVGSRHTAASLGQASPTPSLAAEDPPRPPRGRHPAVRPDPRDEARGRGCASWLGRRAAEPAGPGGRHAAWDRDPEQAASAIEHFADAAGPRVVFVGKMIVSKGVDLLLGGLAARPRAPTPAPAC